MNLAKKTFAVASSAAIAVASLAGFALTANAALHATGTNVSSNGTVYFLDGTSKRPYTSAGAFLSYGFNSFGTVVPASAEDLALPTGAFVPAMDGSLINDMGTVYLITNGQRAGFTSAANFLGLGYSFSNVIAGDTSFMTSAPLISTTDMAHPAGTLVNQAGTVYLITATGKQGIPSLAVFNSWGYSFSKVVPANSYDAALSMSSGIMPAFAAGCLSPLNCTSTGAGTGTGTTTPVATGNVTVTLSTDTPASNPTVVAGQSSADIANFTFNGTGTVTSLTFTRTGVSNNSAIDNVYLYEGGTRLTYGSAVTQNNTVSFSNAAGLFTVNGPTEIMVKADIDSNVGTGGNIAAGQTIGFQLTSGMTGTTAISGAPVSGNLSSVAIASNLAQVVIGTGSAPYGVTPTTGTTVNAGTTNYVLWSSPISVSGHAVTLGGASFQYLGSAPASAFANFALYLDGAQVATSTGINTSNYVVFTPATPIAVATGSHTLEVHADIVGGSNRTAQLTLQNGSDLVVTDTNYNVNVTPKNPSLATYFSPVPAGSVTINTGTLSVSLDPSFNNTTNIPAGASNQVIGSFQLQSYGENVQINNLSITPVIGATVTNGTATVAPTLATGTCTVNSTCSLSNVTVFLNGSQVGNTQNWSGSGALNFNFGSSFIVPAGQTSIFQVKANLQNTSGVNYTAGQIQTLLAAGSSNAQGRTSLNTTSTPAVTGQLLTIGGTVGTLSVNTALTNTSTVLTNSTNQRIGSYVVQAGSAEGLRLNSATIGLTFTGANNPNLSTSYLNNLKVVVSNCSGSSYTASPVNPQSSNTFSLSCNLAANSSATIDVYADIGNAAGSVQTSLTLVGQGQTSNTTFSPALINGQTITASAGSVGTVTLGASAAVSALVASANQPTVGPTTAAAFNFVSKVGTTTIQEMYVSVYQGSTTTAYTSSATAPVTSVTVSGPAANGTTSSASAPVIYTNGGNYAHITGLSILVPQGNAGQDVAVTPTYNFVGTNGLTTGTQARIGLTEYKYQAGQTVTDTGTLGTTVYSNPMEIVASYPVVSSTNAIGGISSGAAFGAGMQVLQFTIAANAAGPVRVKQIQITPYYSGTLTGSGGTVKIYNTANSSTILNGTSGQANLITATGTPVAIILTNDEVIAAGTSKTYTITVDTTGLTTGNSFRIDLTNAGATGALTNGTAAPSSTQWAWNDSTVNNIGMYNAGTAYEQYLDAYLVQNLPVTGPTFTK